MIFDLIVVAVFFFEVRNGFIDGLVKSILKTVGYFAGAVAGLYLALQYDKGGWLVVAILLGAAVGTWCGWLIAKGLKVTILRGPLAWINSLAGALLQGFKVLILAYIVGTVLLWAPWATGQNAIAESKVYLKINTYAPELIQKIREEVEKQLQ